MHLEWIDHRPDSVIIDVIRLILMKLQQQLKIVNLFVMVAVAVAWLVGVSGLTFISIGIATFGFAVLYPEYRFERGIWMLGLLFMSFTAFMIFSGLTDLLWTGKSDEAPRSSYATMWMVIGMATQIMFFAFTVYTSAVNYRLSRT